MKFTYPPEARPLDGYTIKRAIYRGGFGEVYYAVSDAGREVALKLLQNNSEIELRGVQQCLNLSHPNLVTIFDVKQDKEGDHWILMEYIAGETLDAAIRRYPQGMPIETVRKWLPGLTAGVSFLHSRGIVHRDLKPANLFLDNHVVKIGDVGLSKFITPSRRSAQTQSVGTVYYMAPEIAKGRYGKEVDVYATGVILFEMLTGQVPFDGESTGEILMKHLTQQPDLRKLPPRLQTVIGRALHKEAEKRYRSLDELKVAFDNAVLGRPELDDDIEFLPPEPKGNKAAQVADTVRKLTSAVDRNVARQVEWTNPSPSTWVLIALGGWLLLVSLVNPLGWMVAFLGLMAFGVSRLFGSERPRAVVQQVKHRVEEVRQSVRARGWTRPLIGALAGFVLGNLINRHELIEHLFELEGKLIPLGTTLLGAVVGHIANYWRRGADSSLRAAPIVCAAIPAAVIAGMMGDDLWHDDDGVVPLIAGVLGGVVGLVIALMQTGRTRQLHSQVKAHFVSAPAAPAFPGSAPANTLSRMLGSLALATPTCAALTTVLAAFLPRLFKVGPESEYDPSSIGLFLGVSLLGTWGVTVVSHLFRSSGPRQRTSRWHFAVLGAGLGACAGGLSHFLMVDQPSLMTFYRHSERAMFVKLGDLPLYEHGLGPTMMGYIAFFALMFLIRDWSHVVTPFRRSRLSIGAVVWTVAAAWLATMIFPFPRDLALAWSTVIACATQMCNPVVEPRQPGSGLADPPRA